MSREITFRTYVDWNNDGDFSDQYEEVTQDVIVITGPTRGRADVTDQFAAGICSFELLNRHSRYSPFNLSSPLAGLLVPGRPIKFDVINAATPFTQFFGYIGSFGEPRVATDRTRPIIRLDAYDGFEKLRRKKNVRTPLYENKRIDEILNLICDLINWPAALRDFDQSEFTIPFFWADPAGEDALQLMQKAAKQELGGEFFCAKDGKLTFRNRYARASSAVHSTWRRVRAIDMSLREEDLYSKVEYRRSLYALEENLSSVYTLSPTGRRLTLGDNFLDVTFNAPAKDVVTPTIDLDTLTLETTTAETIDASETDILLANGRNLIEGQVIQIDSERMLVRPGRGQEGGKTSLDIIKVTRAYDGTVAATHNTVGTPVYRVLMGVNQDFEANSEDDGDGVDKTNNLSISQFQADAFTAKVGLRSSESAPIFLMLLNIRGRAIRETNENNVITVEVENALVEDSPLIDEFLFNPDEDGVRSYAQLQASVREQPQARPLVELTPIDEAEMQALLTAELGSRVHIIQTGGRYPSQLEDDFFIEAVEWTFESYRGQKPLRLADVKWKLFQNDLSVANLIRMGSDMEAEARLGGATSYWGLANASGVDSIGGRDATPSGSVVAATALTADGDGASDMPNTHYFGVAAHADFDVDTWSLEFWINGDNISNKSLVAKDLVNSWRIAANSARRLTFIWPGNLQTFTTVLNTLQTYHIAVVRDGPGETVKVYLNGVLEGTVSGAADIGSTFSSDLRFGLPVGGIDGRMDDVAWYKNIILNEETILNHYQVGAGLAEAYSQIVSDAATSGARIAHP